MVDLRRIEDLPPLQQEVTQKGKAGAADKTEFNRLLKQARESAGELRFSAHALERMSQRGIELSPDDLEKVKGAVQTAAEKGSHSSLVLLDERAFIISVTNRTVVTALDGEGLKDQVVTEIDSAVII